MAHSEIGVCDWLRNRNKEVVGKVVGYSGGKWWEMRMLGFPAYRRGEDSNKQY